MKAVLHLSSGDRDDQDHALSNAANLLGDDSLDVEDAVLVANGDAVRSLAEGSPFADRVADLREAGLAFRACSNSLRGREIAADDLLPGVERASSGVGEVVRRQADGYRYVKVP